MKIPATRFIYCLWRITLHSNKLEEYLKRDDVIDFENEAITKLADELFQKADSELDFIKAAYEFVRDNISHSADINEDAVTCAASEVLKAGHGICFAKSHLLAALLRAKSVPAGFCYQKLILDDEAAPVLIRAEGFIPRRLRRNKGDETRLRYLMRTTYLDACVEVC